MSQVAWVACVVVAATALETNCNKALWPTSSQWVRKNLTHPVAQAWIGFTSTGSLCQRPRSAALNRFTMTEASNAYACSVQNHVYVWTFAMSWTCEEYVIVSTFRVEMLLLWLRWPLARTCRISPGSLTSGSPMLFREMPTIGTSNETIYQRKFS